MTYGELKTLVEAMKPTYPNLVTAKVVEEMGRWTDEELARELPPSYYETAKVLLELKEAGFPEGWSFGPHIIIGMICLPVTRAE